jgi:magnesium transporter
MSMVKKDGHRSNKKIGLPPGSLVYTGVPRESPTEITLISYDQDAVDTFSSQDLKKIISNFQEKRVNWINFDSLHNISLIEEAGNWANIHNLLLEDILDVSHQPKIEEYDNYLFFTMKMLELDKEGSDYQFDHISFVLGKNYLLSFQELSRDPFDPIRERISTGRGKLRGRGSDYLFILLLDAIVDQYFLLLEKINGSVSQIEIELFENPSEQTVNKIIHQKKELNILRENINPVTEGLKFFRIEESDFINDEYKDNFNDVKDHLKQISDSINNQRESLTSLMEFYMVRVSNQMNEVMKTLTIIATIFIPLTFIAGIYGMNFNNMPELNWKWSYPLLLAFMFVGGTGWYIYMRRRKWF